MRFVSTALIMMTLALMLLALMLLTPTVRANPFVANLAGHESPSNCMISDAELIALWHTKESRSKIAARVQMSRKELQREWRRLQIVGALPMGERISSRRHYATTAVVEIDGRPRVGVLGKGDDPLLKRLRQEYEDDG